MQFTFTQFTILAHIIHLLFPLLIGAHVYVNAICLLLTWAYNYVYTIVFVFCLFVVDQTQRNWQMDLDIRTLPKLMEFEEQLGLMPLECLNVKEQLGLLPSECLKLKKELWKDHILNSLLSILWLHYGTFWCVFSLC